MSKDTLFLFDIDGTLLTSGGAGEKALRLAMQDHFHIDEDLSGVEIAGRTDSGIARQLFQKHHIEPTPGIMSAFHDAYLHRLAQQLPATSGRLLPGILDLLDALKSKPTVSLALLTGNLSRGAKLKLTHYGVWHYFEFGAYADDHHIRNELGPVAAARAREKHGVEFESARVFVLGDTPHDIDCGRAFGAKTVAIATGRHTRAELAAHRPDFLFDDLTDTQGVLAALGV
jgi:phosphoglycolate phosphatase-like HAD superfamily hydrolase